MEVCGDTRNRIEKLSLNECGGQKPADETEITCLSPQSPDPPEDNITPTESSPSQNHHIFAAHLQMKLKSHLEESSSSSCSSSEEYYTISSASHEEDSNEHSSTSEIFYDFDDVVTYGPDEELTSDYGTGGSNSTIVGGGGSTRSNSSSSSDTSSEEGTNGVQRSGSEEEGERSTVRRYQRSSSLKSGKTPPGTPMKKIVRFADAMGLDLTDIKVFLDEIPKVPKEAYRDLHIPDYNGPTSGNSPTNSFSDSWSSKPFGVSLGTRSSTLNFVPLFHQPVSMPDFFDKIRDQKVLLENAFLTEEPVTNTHSSTVSCKHVIKGTVRVMNLDFHKSVYVRYTYNDWKEFVDFQATYIQGSCDGFSDRFQFRIEIDETRLPPPYVKDHDDAKITFACRFHCLGTQFWDNNNSRNYVFQNVPTCTTPSAPSASRPSIFASSSRYSSFDDFDYTCGKLDPPPSKPNFDFVVKQPSPDSAKEQSPPPLTLPPPQPPKQETPQQQQPQQQQVQTSPTTYSTGGGGGSHLSGSMYSPTGFYEPAYGCYNSYGSACFY